MSCDDETNDLIEYQPELSLTNLEIGGKKFEGWLTEVNLQENTYKVNGTWAQALFVAAQNLRSLDNTNSNITHSTVYCLNAGPGLGVWSDGITGYSENTGCTTGAVDEWLMMATGYGTKYIAEATRLSHFAKQISFTGGVPLLESTYGCEEYEAVYGWMFSNTEEFNPQDQIYAVILNLSPNDHTIDFYANSLFSPGSKWEQISISEVGTQLWGEEILPVDGELSANDKLPLLKYSITIIRNPAVLYPAEHPQPIIIQATTTTCPG